MYVSTYNKYVLTTKVSTYMAPKTLNFLWQFIRLVKTNLLPSSTTVTWLYFHIISNWPSKCQKNQKHFFLHAIHPNPPNHYELRFTMSFLCIKNVKLTRFYRNYQPCKSSWLVLHCIVYSSSHIFSLISSF